MFATFTSEAIIILKKAKRPMTAKEISNEITLRGKLKTRSVHPEATLSARILEDVRKNGIKSPFIRTPKGIMLNDKIKL
jgi:repressor of nif and glnA expression